MKNWVKKLLGIFELENILNEKINKLYNLYDEEVITNKIILKHLERLNAEFLVSADINNPKIAPSVILVIPRKGLHEIKEYHFKVETLERVYEMLEGFGKNTKLLIDAPRHFYKPNI